MTSGKEEGSWMCQVSGEDLGLLAWCAMSHDRRLPGGAVPSRFWDMLPQEWRDRINGTGQDPRWEERPPGTVPR